MLTLSEPPSQNTTLGLATIVATVIDLAESGMLAAAAPGAVA
jgi:hypothetical protein